MTTWIDSDQHVSVISIVGMGGVGKTNISAVIVYRGEGEISLPTAYVDVSEIVWKIVDVGGGNCSGATEVGCRAKKKMVEILRDNKRLMLVVKR